MPPSDESLVTRCAAGDQEAFLALHDRFAPRVFGLVVRILGDRTESEDVLQEVMWEAWTRADRYNRTLGSAATWILMIARSRAIDALRKRRAGLGEMGTLAAEPGIAAATAPSGDVQTDPRVRDALEALPSEQQSVISMAFYGGLTREQIAAALNIPVGTVKTRIRLGVRRLAEQSEQLGIGLT